MKSIGIKYQLRITTLIPVLVVALLFAIFYNAQYHRDLKQHTSRLGEAYIRQLLPAAQLALLRNDYRTLQGLTDASIINPEIQALAFYNAQGKLLAYRGGKHSLKHPFKIPEFTGDFIDSKTISPYSIKFVAPITIPKFNLYSFSPFSVNNSPNDFQSNNILGWLTIEVDTQSTLIKRYQMYIVTIFITLLGLLISLGIHYLLSKQIAVPISRLRRSMKQILSNEFETKLQVTSPGEIGIIEKGCEHLQKQYLNTVTDLNQYIEVATQDLQKNLELLEEKNIELSLDKRKTDEKIQQKSEFIANMSHEIRTPMNGIIGFTNLLMESKLDPLQLDYVKTIRSSSQDLLAIINDILDYSKMDAGKLHLDSIPLDIRVCIDDILALLSPNAHKKGIDLIPATALDVPKIVLGDPLHLKQIISNLVSNAIKFTDHGYVLIRTTIEQESDKEYSICIAVTDTGMGISPEDQQSLFNAFNQGDTSITRRFGGSGLGLVICKKIAEYMHGRIQLTSELNKGSTFSAHIKLAKLASYELEKNQVQRFSNLNILCFDENPLYLEALCNGLGYWGAQCILVTAFNQLEQAFQENQHCQMAFININQGCEAQIAPILQKQSMPCVLVSKWAIQDYQALGAKGFLFKPPSIQKLHDAIESLLRETTYDNPQVQELKDLRQRFKAAQSRLLIAEDNPVNRMLLTSLLSDYAEIITVENGEEAVEASCNQRFSCILLDLQMPKLDGLSAAKLIRQQSILNKSAAIVLISANTTNLSKQALHKAGIDLCLQKPISEEGLLRHLLAIINQSKSSLINWPLCVQKASGNAALAEDFLHSFIEELAKNREEFVALMKKGKLAEIESAAHKLHGACCYSGVPLLQTRIAEVETLAKQKKNQSTFKAAFHNLIEIIDAVLTEYEESYRNVEHLN